MKLFKYSRSDVKMSTAITASTRDRCRKFGRILLLPLIGISPFIIESAHGVSELKPVELELTQVTRDSSPVSLGWYPPARRVPLKVLRKTDLNGVDHLSGELSFKHGEIPFVLARSVEGGHFDTLYLSSDDGEIKNKAITGEPRLKKSGAWTIYFSELSIPLNARSKKKKRDINNMSYLFYVVVENKDEVPSFVFTRRTDLRIGKVDLGGAKNTSLVLRDTNMDGVYDKNDFWELVEQGERSENSRSVSDFCWVGGNAWKIEINDDHGKSVRILPHDVEITQEQDKINRDPLREDRISPRADKPVVFRSDVAEAIAEAQEAQKPYFLKFETNWCGPCKVMSELVFPSKDVTDAADEVTCIVVDGDKHKDLVKKHGITGYPTGILFDGKGKQRNQYSGYRGVKEMTDFFSN